MSVALRLDTSVSAHVIAGVLAFDEVTVADRDARMDEPIARTEASMRAAAERADVTTAVRGMYRRFGVDPTKTRPSSEALLRRIRKGEPLPRINSAVDVCNWCSLETQLPFGLYDLWKVTGGIVLRVGREGECYDGIRKDTVNVSGRLALVDDAGPFGNPTSDSARTMVTAETTRVLFVIYTPRVLGVNAAAAAAALTAERTARFCGGRETLREVLS